MQQGGMPEPSLTVIIWSLLLLLGLTDHPTKVQNCCFAGLKLWDSRDSGMLKLNNQLLLLDVTNSSTIAISNLDTETTHLSLALTHRQFQLPQLCSFRQRLSADTVLCVSWKKSSSETDLFAYTTRLLAIRLLNSRYFRNTHSGGRSSVQAMQDND